MLRKNADKEIDMKIKKNTDTWRCMSAALILLEWYSWVVNRCSIRTKVPLLWIVMTTGQETLNLEFLVKKQCRVRCWVVKISVKKTFVHVARYPLRNFDFIFYFFTRIFSIAVFLQGWHFSNSKIYRPTQTRPKNKLRPSPRGYCVRTRILRPDAHTGRII